jgi:lysophospholipase L1-like esterase
VAAMLVVLGGGPSVYSSKNYRASYHVNNSGDPRRRTLLTTTKPAALTLANLLKKADSLKCAKKLNISFAKLLADVKSNRTRLCGAGNNTICVCTNPTTPVDKIGERRSIWYEGLARNGKMIASAPQNLDVVFLGDSIFEHWITGTDLTTPKVYLKGMPELWKSLFEGHALALALSGDRCKNLLFRLLNGEMPDTLQPKAWWILIGTNDISERCSKESILVGNMAVLDEALRRKPNARFILQGLLPRGQERLDNATLWKDFQWINARLSCLTEASSQLEFYNGTSFFLTKNGTNYVNRSLMYDYVHPTLEGYTIMATDMIQRLREWGIWSSTQ